MTTEFTPEAIAEYRKQVRECMLQARKPNGEPWLDEKETDQRLRPFTDDELAFGMPFNTPEEMASVLIEG